MRPQPSANLLDTARAATARWPLVLLVTVAVAGSALVVSTKAGKSYAATADLVSSDEGPVSSLLVPTAALSPANLERQIATDAELITAGGTAHAAQRALGTSLSADDLLEHIEAAPDPTSDILTLTARDRDPKFAAAIANAFAQAYVDFRRRSARRPYVEAEQLAATQLARMTPEELASPDGVALQDRRRELQIIAALQTGGVRIASRATVPEHAARPRPKLSTALGLVLGLVLGVVAAIVLELADRRLKSEKAAEAFFSLPVLGTVPAPRRRAGPGGGLREREAYGLLASNLRLRASDGPGRVLMITSPSPLEDKTSITLGLARSLALLGLWVIAIEADVRRPSFQRHAPLDAGPDLAASPGLGSVLSGGCSLSEALVRIDPTTMRAIQERRSAFELALLPAGQLPLDAARVLGGPAMRGLLDAAREMADVVLIDGAALGTVNDATALLPVVDSTAIVVRLGATTTDAGLRAQRALRGLDVDLAGLVIVEASERPRLRRRRPAARSEATSAGART